MANNPAPNKDTTTASAVITADCSVNLHFALKLEDDAVVDSTFDKTPAKLKIGDGNLPEHFEACLLGLKAGDHRTFELTPETAFGQHNPNNVQRMARSQFSQDLALTPGLVVSFQDAGGNELPGVVIDFDEQDVQVDFNHPLAGKTLRFEVKILAVEH